MEKWLRNTNVVRIAAVLLALLLWVVVHLDEQVTPTPTASVAQNRTFNDIQITDVGLNTEQYYLQSIEPAFVNIVLKGKDSAVNQVRFTDGGSKIQLDLTGISTAGKHILPLESVGFPDGVQVELNPQTVEVTIEEIQNKEVPVQVEVIGNPAEGYVAGTPIMNPIRAIVSVPSSRSDQIVAVKALVDITGVNEAVQETGKLIAVNQTGEEVEAVITPAVVNVEIPITSPFKTIPLQVTLVNQPADGFSVASFEQNITEVTVYGPDAILDELEFYNNIEVDLSGLSMTQNYSIPLPLKEGMHQIKPETVEVEIEIVPSTTKTLQALPIIISGANQEYVTKIIAPETGNIDLIIEGAPKVLSRVSSGNVQAIVDVSNLPQGTHEQTLKLNLPSNVKYGGLAEGLKVSVEISPKLAEEDVDAPIDGETGTDEVEPPPGDEGTGEVTPPSSDEAAGTDEVVPPPNEDARIEEEVPVSDDETGTEDVVLNQ